MLARLHRSLFLLCLPIVLSSCTPLEAPPDAHFGLISVGVVSPPNDAVRRERLRAFEASLGSQFSGSLQDNWVRCMHCDKTDPLEAGLGYIYIFEHGTNLIKFDKAFEATSQQEPKLTMDVTKAPPPPPDCSAKVCSPAGCTCITYSACPSRCRKFGTGPIVCCTNP